MIYAIVFGLIFAGYLHLYMNIIVLRSDLRELQRFHHNLRTSCSGWQVTTDNRLAKIEGIYDSTRTHGRVEKM